MATTDVLFEYSRTLSIFESTSDKNINQHIKHIRSRICKSCLSKKSVSSNDSREILVPLTTSVGAYNVRSVEKVSGDIPYAPTLMYSQEEHRSGYLAELRHVLLKSQCHPPTRKNSTPSISANTNRSGQDIDLKIQLEMN